MLIKMKTQANGPDFSAAPGQLIEVDETRGQDLVNSGHADLAETLWDAEAAAEPVAAPPAAKRERATAKPRATRG